jgi:hypothetical protein
MVCSSLFARAAAFFTITMPRTNSGMSLILLLLM